MFFLQIENVIIIAVLIILAKCDVMNGGCADGNDCATDQITGDVDCTCPLGTMPINDGTCAEVCPNPDGFVMNMDTGKCEGK